MTDKTYVRTVCGEALRRSDRGHDAGDRDMYWARGRGWSWVGAVPSSTRQCEVGAVQGDRYLCQLARRDGVDIVVDPYCSACARLIRETAYRAEKIDIIRHRRADMARPLMAYGIKLSEQEAEYVGDEALDWMRACLGLRVERITYAPGRVYVVCTPMA